MLIRKKIHTNIIVRSILLSFCYHVVDTVRFEGLDQNSSETNLNSELGIISILFRIDGLPLSVYKKKRTILKFEMLILITRMCDQWRDELKIFQRQIIYSPRTHPSLYYKLKYGFFTSPFKT